ncbi:MAG TPA: NUDIX domain-containing protein [Alphaproteobacteria bacterium]|nr:NUDIX domain-containing protein [Alphaproteobacteria bacterium]
MSDELLDLVDENDNVIGQIWRSEKDRQKLTNCRVINAFIKNSNGKLLIFRRSKNKKTLPSWLDMTVGGHVSSGESYEDAFRRETLEEINVDIDAVKWEYLGKLGPLDGVRCFQKIYEIKTDELPDYNKDDFCEYYWLTPKEVIEMIEKGDKAKFDLPVLIKRFYLNES